jgi:hypothetical protein
MNIELDSVTDVIVDKKAGTITIARLIDYDIDIVTITLCSDCSKKINYSDGE